MKYDLIELILNRHSYRGEIQSDPRSQRRSGSDYGDEKKAGGHIRKVIV